MFYSQFHNETTTKIYKTNTHYPLSADFFMLMRPNIKRTNKRKHTNPFCFSEKSYMKQQRFLSYAHVGSLNNSMFKVFDMSS